MKKRTSIMLAVAVLLPLIAAVVLLVTGGRITTQDPLSPGERQWIAAHPVIRVASETHYAPFISCSPDGRCQGISVDYLNLLEQKLGIRFLMLPSGDLSSNLDKVRRGQVDVITSLKATPERSELLLFTRPYIQAPAAIIVKRNITATLSLGSMPEYIIAVGAGYGVQSYIESKYPDLQLAPLPNDVECLQKLSFGEVSAAVVDLASASYIIENQGITNLRIAGDTGYTYELSMASRKDWPILNEILQKGLDRVSREEERSVSRKWINLEHLPPWEIEQARRFIWAALALFLAITGSILLWNRVLRKQIDQRTRDLTRELSERRLSEELLRESENKYRSIINNSVDGLYLFDDQGLVVEWNPGLERITGLAKERARGRAIWDIFYEYLSEEKKTPATRDRFKSYILDLPKTAHAYPSLMEVPILLPDGTRKFIQTNGFAVTLGGRVFHGVIVRDTTERKLAEEALRKSQGTIQSIFSALPVGLCIMRDRVFTSVNRRYCEIFGYPEEKLIGSTTRMLYESDEEYERVGRQLYPRMREAGSASVETRHRCNDGAIRDVVLTVAPILENDASAGIVAVVLDITQRKRYEENLLRLTAIIESTSDLVAIVKPDTSVMYINHSGMAMLGWPPDANTASRMIRDAHPAWAHDKIINEGIPGASRNGTWTGETAILSPDGCEIPVSQTIIAHREPDGAVGNISTIMRDITELKEKEGRIRAALRENQVLMREVHHRTKNNMEVIGSLLALQAQRLDDRHLQDVFSDMQARIRSMALVHEILYKSKDMSTIDMREYLQNLSRALLPEQHIELTLNAERVFVSIDSAAPCGLAVNELLTNALKHAFPGGKSGRIVISLGKTQDGEVHIAVKDDGIGLPENFDMTKASTLGLTLVRNLITRQLQGSLEVQTNGGTRFHIRFTDRAAKRI